MIPDPVQRYISGLLKQATGLKFSSLQFLPVGGGCINTACRLVTDNKDHFFCKVNSLPAYPGLLESEQNGLELLGEKQVIRVPQVIAYDYTGDHQVLILEWIEQGIKTNGFWKLLGEQLAALHRIQAHDFGLPMDNYMGALPQYNQPCDNWCDFFIHRRLEPQVKLAQDKGLLQSSEAGLFKQLYPKLPQVFAPEQPALLHGDLWSGNFLCDAAQKPVLIDPAVYYGHRSIDMGMTTLFGGFDPLFYETYHRCFPLPANYREQWEICNLYPLLIHLNLFGSGYLHDILQALRRYS